MNYLPLHKCLSLLDNDFFQNNKSKKIDWLQENHCIIKDDKVYFPSPLFDLATLHSLNPSITLIRYYLASTSTNTILNQISAQETIHKSIIITESQLIGYGKYNRPWISSPFSDITFSIGYCFNQFDISLAHALSSITALAVINTLDEFGISNCLFKWPNDVIVNYKKIAGILINTCNILETSIEAITGIGLNISPKQIDQSTISISELLNSYSKTLILAKLIQNIDNFYHYFKEKGLSAYLPLLNQYNALQHKKLTIIKNDQLISGTVIGFNSEGYLQIKTTNSIEIILISDMILDIDDDSE